MAQAARHAQLLKALGAERGADPLCRRRGPRRSRRVSGQRHRPRHPDRARRGDRSGWRRPTSRRSRPASIMARSPRSATARRSRSPRLRRDVSTDGRRATVAFTEIGGGRGAARLHHQRAARRSRDRRNFRLFRRPRRPSDSATSGSSANRSQRIAEDHLRILRFFRFHARFGSGEPDPGARSLRGPRQRPDGPVARTHRRRAAETARPARSRADRRDHARPRDLEPVLPEIEPERLP